MRSRLLGLAAMAAFVLTGSVARADGLSQAETGHLLRGDTVARAQQMQRADRRYVGGVTYTILDAGTEDLASLLDDVRSWRRFLPSTRDAHRVGSAGPDALVEVTHGSALVRVAYTLRIHRDGNVVRFWMDSSRSHDIEDVWGFFRAEPLPDGRTLMTYGILIDMGSGLLRDLFEGRVQVAALEVPDHVRDVVLERTSRGRRASR